LRRHFASLFTLALLTAGPAHAVMEDYPSVKLQGLDKSVGRTVTFEAKVGSTIQYGPLFIKIHACRKAPPIETPESAAFLQIWEVPPGAEKSEWAFSGWMFASSPALSAMDHPVYDVWVLDCLGREEPNEEAKAAETDEQADQTSLPATTGEATEQEPIPTDSEAEPEEAAPIVPDPNAAITDPAAAPVTTDVAPAQDPASDGFTAYDLMKQGATPAPRPVAPEPYPTYTPPAQDSVPEEEPPQY